MKRKSGKYLLALLPFVVVVFLYEIMPLATIITDSFRPEDRAGGMLGFDNYIKIFTTPLYQTAVVNSIKISIISALAGIVIAFIGAKSYDCASEKFKNIFTMILNMTSNFSGVPLAFAFMLLLGNTGVFTTLGKEYGISWLANYDLYTGQGLTFVYIYFQIPMATLLLIPSFSAIRNEWKEAAMLLKATPVDFWLRVGIPVLLPGILGTLSVLFSNALAAYATAYALVASNYALLPLQISSKFKGDVRINKELGGALSVVMILLMIIATLINNYLTKKMAKGGTK